MLWHEWAILERPWVGTELPCDESDKQLFAASTVVSIGDGSKAKFWHASWLNREGPKDRTEPLCLGQKEEQFCSA